MLFIYTNATVFVPRSLVAKAISKYNRAEERSLTCYLRCWVRQNLAPVVR